MPPNTSLIDRLNFWCQKGTSVKEPVNDDPRNSRTTAGGARYLRRCGQRRFTGRTKLFHGHAERLFRRRCDLLLVVGLLSRQPPSTDVYRQAVGAKSNQYQRVDGALGTKHCSTGKQLKKLAGRYHQCWRGRRPWIWRDNLRYLSALRLPEFG